MMDGDDGKSFPTFRCKICRQVLFTGDVVVDSHNERYSFRRAAAASVCEDEFLWFLQEEKLVAWVTEAVEKEGWTKGRLVCPKCSTRLGSFDFVCGTKCACGRSILPPVHISRGKLDTDILKESLKLNTVSDHCTLQEQKIDKTTAPLSDSISFLDL